MVLAVMTPDWKLLHNKQKGNTELYRLGDPETPKHDQFDTEDEVVEELLAIVRQREDAIAATNHDRDELSDEVRTRLHELGYVGE